jgi:hypothetical protein
MDFWTQKSRQTRATSSGFIGDCSFEDTDVTHSHRTQKQHTGIL